jgi:hypothetical protein
MTSSQTETCLLEPVCISHPVIPTAANIVQSSQEMRRLRSGPWLPIPIPASLWLSTIWSSQCTYSLAMTASLRHSNQMGSLSLGDQSS